MNLRIKERERNERYERNRKSFKEKYSGNFHVQAHELTKVLCNMLEKGHGEAMLSRKTKELLNKLEIM